MIQWADEQRFPNETDDRAMARRIRMHEFLMPGGVQTGYVNGKMTYSEPVDPTTDPVCPWHGQGCSAWTEIAEGRGLGKQDGPTITELREMDNELEVDRRTGEIIERGTRRVTSEPEYISHKPKQVGNPWDRKEPALDARNTVITELAFEDIPDTIEIEGEEDE